MNRAVITRMEVYGIPALVCVLIADGKAVEIRIGEEDPSGQEGTVLTAMTERIAENIQAAFLNDGSGTHFYLPLKYAPSALKCGQVFPVQITREKSGQKLISVTARVSLPGRYFVMSPGEGTLRVSRKLSGEEQRRLLETVRTFEENDVPDRETDTMIRTNASSASADALKREYLALKSMMQRIRSVGSMRKPGCVLYRPDPFYLVMLRDIPAEFLTEIVTDLPEIKEVLDVWRENLAESFPVCRLYQDPHLPLFRLYGLTSVLEKIGEEKVWLSSGGFLVIQRTEAFTAIDVNSGKNTQKKDKEETLFRLNMEAAEEVCRQIRLRNLSGAILVDFANMEKPEHLESLKAETARLLKTDRIHAGVIDMTKLQIMEITRNKTSPPVAEILDRLRKKSEKHVKTGEILIDE